MSRILDEDLYIEKDPNGGFDTGRLTGKLLKKKEPEVQLKELKTTDYRRGDDRLSLAALQRITYELITLRLTSDSRFIALEESLRSLILEIRRTLVAYCGDWTLRIKFKDESLQLTCIGNEPSSVGLEKDGKLKQRQMLCINCSQYTKNQIIHFLGDNF